MGSGSDEGATARRNEGAAAGSVSNAALDQRVEQPAEQPLHRMRVVHVDQVEAEQDDDDIDDQDHVQDVRHGGTLAVKERRAAILSRRPGTKKPGLKPGFSN